MGFWSRLASALALALAGAPAIGVAARGATGARAMERGRVLHVLFVGDSLTHGRYEPVRGFAAGDDGGPGAGRAAHVHDLLCPSASRCVAAETVAPTDPDRFRYPPGVETQATKLVFLLEHPGDRYAEPGPFGGVPGIVLRLAEEARVRLDVSIMAASGSTLEGRHLAGDPARAALIESARWDRVVLQERSALALPASVEVAGRPVATTGDPGRFEAGLDAIVAGIDAADAAAGRAPIPVTLFETPPIASSGFTSDDPAKPLFGTRHGLSEESPFISAAHPMVLMERYLRAAYDGAASRWNAAHPGGSTVDVAPVGAAWIAAMGDGVAERDPYLAHEREGTVDLWDGDPLDACCTVPIGHHSSASGAYLDALVLLRTIAGVDPRRFGAGDGVARALGVPAWAVVGLQAAAAGE